MENETMEEQGSMKKVLLSLLLLGVIFSCGKKEENSTENSGTVNVESESSTPKFKDPEVQKLAEAYTELSKEYDNMTPEKAGELSQKFQELSSKGSEIAQKLSSDPKEAEKFANYMTEIGKEIQAKMTK